MCVSTKDQTCQLSSMNTRSFQLYWAEEGVLYFQGERESVYVSTAYLLYCTVIVGVNCISFKYPSTPVLIIV